MNYFTLDGHSTTEWGIGLSAGGAYDAPARKGESISVPGRNGNIWVDDGSFENIMLTYPCWMSEDFDANIDGFRAFLSLHSDQYYELRDTYHPNEYRLARYAGAFTADPGTRNKSGRFDVVFDCYPQRFLDSGNTWTALTIGGTTNITNPTPFDAAPVICFQKNQETVDPRIITFSLKFSDSRVETFTQSTITLQASSHHAFYIDTADFTVREDEYTYDVDSANWQSLPFAAGLPVLSGDADGLVLKAGATMALYDGTTGASGLGHLAILPRWYTI